MHERSLLAPRHDVRGARRLDGARRGLRAAALAVLTSGTLAATAEACRLPHERLGGVGSLDAGARFSVSLESEHVAFSSDDVHGSYESIAPSVAWRPFAMWTLDARVPWIHARPDGAAAVSAVGNPELGARTRVSLGGRDLSVGLRVETPSPDGHALVADDHWELLPHLGTTASAGALAITADVGARFSLGGSGHGSHDTPAPNADGDGGLEWPGWPDHDHGDHDHSHDRASAQPEPVGRLAAATDAAGDHAHESLVVNPHADQELVCRLGLTAGTAPLAPSIHLDGAIAIGDDRRPHALSIGLSCRVVLGSTTVVPHVAAPVAGDRPDSWRIGITLVPAR